MAPSNDRETASSDGSIDDRILYGIENRQAFFPQRRPRLDDTLYQAVLPPYSPPPQKQRKQQKRQISEQLKTNKSNKERKVSTNDTVQVIRRNRLFNRDCERRKGDVENYLTFCRGLITTFEEGGNDYEPRGVDESGETESSGDVERPGYLSKEVDEQCLQFLHRCDYDIELAKFRLLGTLGGGNQESLVRKQIQDDLLFEKHSSEYADELEESKVSIEQFEQDHLMVVKKTSIKTVKLWSNVVKSLVADKTQFNSSALFTREEVVSLLKYGLTFESVVYRLAMIKTTELMKCQASTVMNPVKGEQLVAGEQNTSIERAAILSQQQEILCDHYKNPIYALSLLKRRFKKLSIFLARCHDIVSYGKPRLSRYQKRKLSDIDDIISYMPKNIEVHELPELQKVRALWIDIENRVDNFLQAIKTSPGRKVRLPCPDEADIRELLETCKEEGILWELCRKLATHLEKVDDMKHRINSIFPLGLYTRSGTGKLLSLRLLLTLKEEADELNVQFPEKSVLCFMIQKADRWLTRFEVIFSDQNHKIKDLIALKKKADRIPVDFAAYRTFLDNKIKKAQEWLSKIKFNLKGSSTKTKQTRSNVNNKEHGNSKVDIMSLKAFRKEAVHLGLEPIEITNLDSLIFSVESWLVEASMTIKSASLNVVTFLKLSSKSKKTNLHEYDFSSVIGNLDGKEIGKELELLRYKAEEFPVELSNEFKFIQAEVDFYNLWQDIVNKILASRLTLKQLRSKLEELRNIRKRKLPKSCGYLNLQDDEDTEQQSESHSMGSQHQDSDTELPKSPITWKPGQVNSVSWKAGKEQVLISLLALAENYVTVVADVALFMVSDEDKWLEMTPLERTEFMQHREEEQHLFELNDLKEILLEARSIPMSLTDVSTTLELAIKSSESCATALESLLSEPKKCSFQQLLDAYVRFARWGVLCDIYQTARRHIMLCKIWLDVVQPFMKLCQEPGGNTCERNRELEQKYRFFGTAAIETLRNIGETVLLPDVSAELACLEQVAELMKEKDHLIKKGLKAFYTNCAVTSTDLLSTYETCAVPETDIRLLFHLKPSEEEYDNLSNAVKAIEVEKKGVKSPVPAVQTPDSLEPVAVEVEKLTQLFRDLAHSPEFFLVQNLRSFYQLKKRLEQFEWINWTSKYFLATDIQVQEDSQPSSGDRLLLNDLLQDIVIGHNLLVDHSKQPVFFLQSPVPPAAERLASNRTMIEKRIRNLAFNLEGDVPFSILSLFCKSQASFEVAHTELDVNKRLSEDLLKLRRRSSSQQVTGSVTASSAVQNSYDDDLIVNSRPRRGVKPVYTVKDLQAPLAGYMEVMKTGKSAREGEAKPKTENGATEKSVVGKRHAEQVDDVNKVQGLLKLKQVLLVSKKPARAKDLFFIDTPTKVTWATYDSLSIVDKQRVSPCPLLAAHLHARKQTESTKKVHPSNAESDSSQETIGECLVVPKLLPTMVSAVEWFKDVMASELSVAKGSFGQDRETSAGEKDSVGDAAIDQLHYVFSRRLLLLQNEIKKVVIWRSLARTCLKSTSLKQSVENNSYFVLKRLLQVKNTDLQLRIKLKEEGRIKQELEAADSWLKKVRALTPSGVTARELLEKGESTKPSEALLEKLLSEGQKLKGYFEELDYLRKSLKSAKKWLSRLKESGLEKGEANVLTLRELLREAETVPVDLSRHTAIVEEATKRYCFCRKPRQTDKFSMISCETCSDLFHKQCIFYEATANVLKVDAETVAMFPFEQLEAIQCARCLIRRKLAVLKGIVKMVYIRVAVSLETIDENDSFDKNQTSRDYHFFAKYSRWAEKCFELFQADSLLQAVIPDFDTHLDMKVEANGVHTDELSLRALRTEFSVFSQCYDANLLLQCLYIKVWCLEALAIINPKQEAGDKFSLISLRRLVEHGQKLSDVVLFEGLMLHSAIGTPQAHHFAYLPGTDFFQKLLQRADGWLSKVHQLINNKTMDSRTIVSACNDLAEDYNHIVVEFPAEVKKVLAILDDSANRYCSCNGFNIGHFMIGCEVCEKWFHGDCVHLTKEQGESLTSWTCPGCTTSPKNSI